MIFINFYKTTPSTHKPDSRCPLCGNNYQGYNHTYPYVTYTEISSSELSLSNTLRSLWEQHTVWTRATIVSMVFDLPDVEFVTMRLLQNPEDFGNLFRMYYGDMIGSEFSALMKDHLVIAAEIVTAAKAGDNTTMAEAERRWYANADDIAAFLASINPYWSEEDWRNMLYTHLGLVKEEAVNLLTRNYEEQAPVYDELEAQALEMAYMMTKGIISQFPNLFLKIVPI